MQDELLALDVLVVEDDQLQVRLITEALRRAMPQLAIEVASDGDVALMQLRSRRPSQLPALVLLDLNLPRMGGHEVLAEIRSDPMLRRLPIVIVSSSKHDADISRAYDGGANAYVNKPTSFTGYLDLSQALQRFWAQHVVPPPVPSPTGSSSMLNPVSAPAD
jgi:chemotaxis family two-component system response regulator Rcp1